TNAAEVAAPAKVSLSGVGPSRPSEPMRYTPTAVRPAQTIATWVNAVAVVRVNQAMQITTAREAPVVTPRIPGSAPGLRVAPCITAPESASPTPTRRESQVREL